MSEVPVLVVNKFKVRELELGFYHFAQLIFYLSCPISYKDYKSIYIPSNSATRHISVIAFEFCFQSLNMSTIIFFCPNLAMQLRVCYKRYTIFFCLFQHFRSQFHFVDSKKLHLFDIEPEYANTRHSSLSKFFHAIHYCIVFFLCSFSHIRYVFKLFIANIGLFFRFFKKIFLILQIGNLE